MRLSETITIYLAIAAPFGVNYFLREQDKNELRRARSAFKAMLAGLLWPVAAAAALLSRRMTAALLSPDTERESEADEKTNEKIKAAQERVFIALERVRELAQATAGHDDEELERSIRVAREGIEKYVGLTLAQSESDLDAPPAHHELELCRVAGRAGDDLLLAGRCLHRRNITRLAAHQARSRTELLHALAAVRELSSGQFANSSADGAAAARHLSAAMLSFFGETINLLSRLEDENAAIKTARLLDAECARLRKLEALSLSTEETNRTEGEHVRHTRTERGALAQR